MSKDSAQSRIPRFDSVSSRIPVPGTFRLPSGSVSRLPPKRPIPATPISFLRPPSRSGAIARSYSGDRLSHLSTELTPIPVLTTSTPAPEPRVSVGVTPGVPFLRKLDLVTTTPASNPQIDGGVSTERLEDIKLCQREFGLPSDDEDRDERTMRPEEVENDDADEEELAETTMVGVAATAIDGIAADSDAQMLVDESLELVGAHSTDNLLDPPLATVPPPSAPAQSIATFQQSLAEPAYLAGGYNPHEYTVTLQRDGNVTYEIRRSATFLKSSRESLASAPSPLEYARPIMNSTQTYQPAVEGMGLTFRRESSGSIDSPVLGATRTIALHRRPSTGELLTDDEDYGPTVRPRVLSNFNSTMVHDRLVNVTQSIPNITQELADSGPRRDSFRVPGDSILPQTMMSKEKEETQGGGMPTTTMTMVKKPNRLTFHLDDSMNLMHFSGTNEGKGKRHNSTMHGSDPGAFCAAPLRPAVSEDRLMADLGTTMLQDVSFQDQTLIATDLTQDRTQVQEEEEVVEMEEEEEDEYAAERRRLNEKLELADTTSVGDMSAGKEIFDLSLDEPPATPEEEEEEEEQLILRRRSVAPVASKQRYSFGLDLTECTLDCSIELCDSSLSLTKPPPSMASHLKSPTTSLSGGHVGSLTKQGSFEMDESLGILTPDQMKEFLDSTTTNTNNTGNGLELHLNTTSGAGLGGAVGAGGSAHHKHGGLQHHCRIDQTPSPEELPLDPVGVKTDMTDILLPSELLLMSGSASGTGGGAGASGSGGVVGLAGIRGCCPPNGEVSQADSDPKTDQMTKSATSSKVSNSFITSITSITSLDTGYQGDGEMSRPASRGADHSPSNGPRPVKGGWQPLMAAAIAVVPRRQDPMTDSDFFTESDADDVFNRGDARRAQIIDGQLYGAGAGAPGGAGAAIVGAGTGAGGIGAPLPGGNAALFHALHGQPMVLRGGDGGVGVDGANEDSCMESSGIFTDVENRADDDLVQRRADDQLGRRGVGMAAESPDVVGEEGETDGQSVDLSPADTSTDTISSSNSQNFDRTTASIPHPPGGSITSSASTVATVDSNETEQPMNRGTLIEAHNAPNPNDYDAHYDANSSNGDHQHQHRQSATTTTATTTTTAALNPLPIGPNSDSGCCGVGDVAAGAAAADGGGCDVDSGSGVAHGAGSIARRRLSTIDLNSPVARSSPNGSVSGGGSSKRQPTSAVANRKQAKNDSNRGLRKQHHASGGGMPGSAGRTERKGAFRLSKERCSSERGSRDGAGSGVVGEGYEETPPSSMTYGGSAGSTCSAGDCDQDNKRPTMAIGTRGVSVRATTTTTTTGGSNLSFVKKSGPGAGGTPNKWDAVMSKIAENKKSVPRRSFSEVKSRVSCGNTAGGRVSLVRRDSPATASGAGTTPKSPPSEAVSITSRISSVSSSKRTISAKRGRTQSKDSQQSSLSDLSLSGGSPKLTPKVSSTRPAKKRDVRTINSSSSDLGPPPSKTNGTQQQQQQPSRSSAARAAAALQKRISSNSSSAATNPLLVPEQLKGSPPTKRNLLLKRNGTSKADSNRLEREHNRLVGASPATKSASAAVIHPASTHSPKPATKSLIRSSTTSNSISGSGGGTSSGGTTATANQQTPAGQHNHAAGSNGVTSVKAIQRNGTIILDKTSSPLLLSEERPKPAAATTPKATPVEVTGSARNGAAAVGAGGESICDRRDRAMVAIRSDREHHPPGVAGKQSSVGAAASVAITSNSAALQQQQQAQQQQQQQQLVDVSLLNHAEKGVEALGVLVQYLVFNLDAFSCPTIKTAHQKTTHDLLEARSMLDDARTSSQTLKQQLLETTERETELQELHRCELSRVETCLTEQQRNAEDRIATLQSQQHEQESYNRELLARIDDYEAKVAAQAKQLENARTRELDLLQRINALSCTENELREKVHSSELAFSERLQAAAMRERDLTEQIKGLNRDLDRMRRETEQKERELEEKLTITKDECVVLRKSRQSLVALDTATSSAAQNGTSTPTCLSTSANPLQLNRSSGSINHLQVLQDEVDSLRCVLDLKQREISDLRKQTQQYERDAKELPAALVKISALESRIEDLQVQLKTKTEEEKDLQQKLKLLQDNLSQESKIKSRLSLHNEELQWRLKQNSEKFTLAYAELSKSYHENSSYMMLNASKSSLDHTVGAGGGSQLQSQSQQQQQHPLHHTSRSSCSDRFFDMDDISPPTSPVIKGMVEKSDSVSWVLEIDDEPPEVSASRMVRRAGSFRSGAAYTESVAKRPKCGLNQSNGGGIQQSTSAASILKQHSGDVSPTKQQAACGIPPVHQRLRSKSVSIKAAEPPKKIVRSNSGNSATASSVIGCPSKPMRMSEMGMGPWKEQPLYSSSPYAHKRYLTEDNSELAGTSKQPFGGEQPHRTKDLFLEETEVLSEPESPFARRPPHLNGEDVLTLPAEVFHRDKTPKFKKSKENRGLITCDTTVLTGSPKTTNGGGAGGVAAGLLPSARDKRREFTRKANGTGTGGGPLEAAGEALVSGANSDDEATSSTSSSASSSSSCSLSEGSLSSGSSAARNALNGMTAGSSKRRNSDQMNGADDAIREGANPAKEHRRRLSNISLEDALMKKIVASLNGGTEGNDTPMEVSWSEDGEDPASESIV
ncbi:uncharacterized protein LOC126572197 isoform X2 [Anopheles aquasalis]|uniref:uncharacterized protein LOC126572197 isoform X2 n=1 Tax=Anopheles aquasalis TaxID=42839 RepID=UPI00215B738D|nr:uncharacterized protein LOC126572197 isoform X2 [Anopheles aquasalis]